MQLSKQSKNQRPNFLINYIERCTEDAWPVATLILQLWTAYCVELNPVKARGCLELEGKPSLKSTARLTDTETAQWG